MIVGNGLIAKTLENSLCNNRDILIFASGVSNSSEISDESFMREKVLLKKYLSISNKKKMLVIYFSSCALVDSKYLSIPYYQHKNQMEQIIKKNAKKFIIFRLPQLIGKSENKNTLINYLVEKIKIGEEFKLWQGATRYLIEIDDLKKILEALVYDKLLLNQTVEIANPYRYLVEEIVNTIESYMNLKANYKLIDKKDSYLLDLEMFLSLCKNQNIQIDFGKNYLYQKLEKII